MTVLPVNLRDPKGPVQRAMFPDDDLAALDARLQGYIDQSVVLAAPIGTEPLKDKFTKNYSLYLAFDAAHTLFMTLPARTRKEGENSLEYLEGQIDGLMLKAKDFLAEASAVLPQPVPAGALPRTGTTPNRFVR